VSLSIPIRLLDDPTRARQTPGRRTKAPLAVSKALVRNSSGIGGLLQKDALTGKIWKWERLENDLARSGRKRSHWSRSHPRATRVEILVGSSLRK